MEMKMKTDPPDPGKRKEGRERASRRNRFRICPPGFILYAGLFFPVCLLLCSCAGQTDGTGMETESGEYVPSEEDKLTKQEIKDYIHHAREIAGKAKLVSAEREMIRELEPELDIRYRGRKRGKMTIEWKLPTTRLVRLTVTGDFLVKRPRWHLQIMTYETPSEGASYRFLGENETLRPFVPPGK